MSTLGRRSKVDRPLTSPPHVVELGETVAAREPRVHDVLGVGLDLFDRGALFGGAVPAESPVLAQEEGLAARIRSQMGVPIYASRRTSEFLAANNVKAAKQFAESLAYAKEKGLEIKAWEEYR